MNTTEALGVLLDNRTLFIETLVRIEDKRRNLVPFYLNPIQKLIIEQSTFRDVYTKPAQVGASSICICDFLIDCLTIPGTVSIIISYDEFITQRLLRKAQAFDNHLRARIPTLPRLVNQSTYEKVYAFEDAKGRTQGLSSFYISSARSFAYGRGETIHNLMADEFAYWPPGEAAEFVASAIQRVPLEPGTKIRIPSTPNGEDNEFCEVYQAAKEGKDIGQSTFNANFYPWYLHPEYTMHWTSQFCLPGDSVQLLPNLNEEEVNLMLRFQQLGVENQEAHNKIRWRRYKQAEFAAMNRSGETRKLFGQEYPEDDVSCFLAAGDQAYDHETVNYLARHCFPNPNSLPIQITGTIGTLDIWKDRVEGERYLVAVDPGEGKQSISVGTVWTFPKGKDDIIMPTHHATFAGLFAQDKMAALAKEVGKYYNWATITWEDSLGFSTHWKDYGNIYLRTDPISGRVGSNPGWQTNKETKRYMVGEVARLLANTECHDIRIISQLRNIRWSPDKFGAEKLIVIGADDFHDSMAIGIVCRDALPTFKGVTGVAGWDDNWGVIVE